DLVGVGRRALEAAASGYEWLFRPGREREDGPAERGVGEGGIEHRAHDRASGVSSTCWSMWSLARMNWSSVSSASGPKQMVALPFRLMMRVIEWPATTSAAALGMLRVRVSMGVVRP